MKGQIRKRAVVPSGTATISQRMMDLRPVTYWRLSEASGASAVDYSGHAVTGTYNGSPTLAQPGIGDGLTSILFTGTQYLSLGATPLAALSGLYSGSEASVVLWFKAQDAATWSEGTLRRIMYFRVSTSNYFILNKALEYTSVGIAYNAGGTAKSIQKFSLVNPLGWHCLVLTVSKTNDRLRMYVDGVQEQVAATSLGVWAPGTGLAFCYFGGDSSKASLCFHAHAAIYAYELSPAQVRSLKTGYPIRSIMAIGDSKTNGKSWVQRLCDNLVTATGQTWGELPSRYGVSGQTVATCKAGIDAFLSGCDQFCPPPEYVLYDLGVNDASALPAEATWEANYLYIIDAIEAKWPGRKHLVTYPGNQASDANCATLHGWIDTVIAARPTLNIAHLDDERVWLKGADNYATNTLDGTHPTEPAGYTLMAAAKQTAMGM